MGAQRARHCGVALVFTKAGSLQGDVQAFHYLSQERGERRLC